MVKQRRTINFTILIATITIIFGTLPTISNSAWADIISCPNARPVLQFEVCFGTNGTNDSKNIKNTSIQDPINRLSVGDHVDKSAKNDPIFGYKDDDIIKEDSINNDVKELSGNDNMTGTSGNDLMIGGSGADVLEGASGNDAIYQAGITSATSPDGFKDEIHCGPGIDKVWINISHDRDTADKSCETIHKS